MKRTEQLARSFLFFSFIGITACSPDEAAPNKPEATTETEKQHITLTSAQYRTSNMDTAPLQMKEFAHALQVNGTIEVPPRNKATVSAYFGGYVQRFDLLPGQKVRKGQRLFILENPEYVQVQQDFLEAKNQLGYLKSDYERQKGLAEENISSQKKYLKAETDYQVTLVTFESLKKKLQLMHIDPEKLDEGNIQTYIPVYAPITGYLTGVAANNGTYLSPSDHALTIINTEHMHVELSVFENNLPNLSKGQIIRFKTQQANSPFYEAEIYLIDKTVDPEKRTGSVHGHMLNERDHEKLNPGMYVEAEILTSGTRSLSLPQEAVVELENRYYTLVMLGKKQDSMEFERREVKVGQTYQGYVEILNHQDFPQNMEFLSKGVFNLITE